MDNKLIDLLSIFRQSRKKLSQDFLNESLEIFEPMFKYENDNELMNLAMEKYFIGYINYHFEIFSDYKDKDIDVKFSKAMLSFLKNFSIGITNTNLENGKELFSMIIQQKESFLNELIYIGNIDNDKFNKLSYLYHKDKTLFDREINKPRG